MPIRGRRADENIMAAFPPEVPVLRVWNKIDLSGHKPSVDEMADAVHVYLSAHENLGIDLLRAELLRIAGWQQTGESLYLARERHLIALKNAGAHLARAVNTRRRTTSRSICSRKNCGWRKLSSRASRVNSRPTICWA
jgi:tRNA U34 5-carboxymethylaminomethyl modifying GTPase MnmE/TrmE